MAFLSERMRTLVVAFAAVCLFTACASLPQRRPQARVRFIIEPADARVYVEDRFVGAAPVLRRRPATFSTGRRHFTITAQEHFPHDIETDLAEGLTTIRVRLRPIPP